MTAYIVCAISFKIFFLTKLNLRSSSINMHKIYKQTPKIVGRKRIKLRNKPCGTADMTRLCWNFFHLNKFLRKFKALTVLNSKFLNFKFIEGLRAVSWIRCPWRWNKIRSTVLFANVRLVIDTLSYFKSKKIRIINNFRLKP